MRIIALLLGSLLAAPLAAQQCVVSFTLTAAGNSGVFNNLTKGCTNWTVTYNSTGFTGLSLTVQTAPNNSGSPGTWSTFTAASGSNPSTAITQASATFSGYFPFLRVNLSGLTGTGTVTGLLYGVWTDFGGGGGGGGTVTAIGPDAPGSPSTQNPVQVAGNDGTDVRNLRLSTSGRLELAQDNTSQADGAANTPTSVSAGAANTVFRTYGYGYNSASNVWDRIRANTVGVFVHGGVANGTSVSGVNPVLLAGSTGASGTGNVRTLRVNNQGSIDIAGGGSAITDNWTNSANQPNCDGGGGCGVKAFHMAYDEVSGGWDRVRGSDTAGIQIGGRGSGAAGVLSPIPACDSSAVVNVAAGATTQIVPLTASRSVRVCAFSISSDTTLSSARWVYGTGTNCGTGTTNLTGAYALGVNSIIASGAGIGQLFSTAASNALCLAAVAGGITGVVTYAVY